MQVGRGEARFGLRAWRVRPRAIGRAGAPSLDQRVAVEIVGEAADDRRSPAASRRLTSPTACARGGRGPLPRRASATTRSKPRSLAVGGFGGKFARARRGDIGVAGAGEQARRLGQHAARRDARARRTPARARAAPCARASAAGGRGGCAPRAAGAAADRARAACEIVDGRGAAAPPPTSSFLPDPIRHATLLLPAAIMHRRGFQSTGAGRGSVRAQSARDADARPGRRRRCRRGRNSRSGSWRGTAGDSPRRSRTPAGRRSRW